MASTFLYKPVSDGQLNRGGASFLLYDRSAVEGGIYDAEGNLVKKLTRSDIGSTSQGRPIKFYSQEPGTAFGQGFTFKVKYQDGREEAYNISNSGSRFEGQLGSPDSIKPTAGRGNVGAGGMPGPGGGFAPNTYGMGSGAFGPGAFQPGVSPGGFAAVPSYLGAMFPQTALAQFSPISIPDYKYTDPITYAQTLGEVNRETYLKNIDVGRDVALEALGTELLGLTGFATATGALKRQQTALDNIFNLAEREKAVETALPGTRAALEAQRGRAETMAEGRLPSAVDDAALELGLRSRAADMAAAGGFGARSSVARKTSDLLSAEQRLQISQMGEQALQRNIALSADLMLPPTSYSDAGAQIRTMPSFSPGELQFRSSGELNQYALLNPGAALQFETGQQQFKSQLQQRTGEFNAQGMYNASLSNAQMINQANQSLWQYNVAYGSALAGAMQTDINTQVGIWQQQRNEDITREIMQRVQESQEAGQLAAGAASVVTGIIGSILGRKKENQTGPFESEEEARANYTYNDDDTSGTTTQTKKPTKPSESSSSFGEIASSIWDFFTNGSGRGGATNSGEGSSSNNGFSDFFDFVTGLFD